MKALPDYAMEHAKLEKRDCYELSFDTHGEKKQPANRGKEESNG